MHTLPNPPATITQMGHISALASPTCYSWSTQNTDPNDQPTNLFQGKALPQRVIAFALIAFKKYGLLTQPRSIFRFTSVKRQRFRAVLKKITMTFLTNKFTWNLAMQI